MNVTKQQVQQTTPLLFFNPKNKFKFPEKKDPNYWNQLKNSMNVVPKVATPSGKQFIQALKLYNKQLKSVLDYLLNYQQQKKEFLTFVAQSIAFLLHALVTKNETQVQEIEAKLGSRADSILHALMVFMEHESSINKKHLAGQVGDLIQNHTKYGSVNN